MRGNEILVDDYEVLSDPFKNITRRKVTKFNFRQVSMKEIEKKIIDITNKPSYSTCGILYNFFFKLKGTNMDNDQ